MAMIESVAVFRQRAEELQTGLRGRLESQGLSTFRGLAFALGTPQTPPSQGEFDAFALRVLGAGYTLAQAAALRALHFEASTLVVASLKEQISHVSGQAETVAKRIPNAERRVRAATQRAKLAGVEISGELEPSYALLDLCNEIVESGNMSWVAPSRCGKRSAEVQNSIKAEAKQHVQIEKSQLIVTPSAPKQHVDTNNEIKVYWALSRRAIAMDQCALISYGVQMQWIQSMMEAMSEEAPPGYAKVGIAQALRSDKELFTLLARKLPGPYRAAGTGPPPCDAGMQQLVAHARVQQMLLPLPSLTKGSRQDNTADADSDDAPPKPRPKKKAKAQPKKPNAASVTKPQELATYDCKHEGKPICWWFNVAAGCQQKIAANKKAETARCRFGLHVCAKCKKDNHGLASCRSKE